MVGTSNSRTWRILKENIFPCAFLNCNFMYSSRRVMKGHAAMIVSTLLLTKKAKVIMTATRAP